MPRPTDVVMAKSIYDDNELLPEAIVINKPTDIKQPLVNPDMERSNDMERANNRWHDANAHSDDCGGCCDCDGCCDGCCDNDMLLCCFICYMCND